MEELKLVNIKYIVFLCFCVFGVHSESLAQYLNCLTSMSSKDAKNARRFYKNASRYSMGGNPGGLQEDDSSDHGGEDGVKKVDPQDTNGEPRKSVEKIDENEFFDVQQLTFSVNVYVNISGNKSNIKEHVKGLINDVNKNFKAINIRFSIDNLYELNYPKHFHFREKNMKSFFVADRYDNSKICLYIFDELISDNNLENNNAAGFARFPWDDAPNNVIVATKSFFGDKGNNLTHEFGHFFGLFHTHESRKSKRTKELVNGSNSKVTGDLIDDTPADPGLNPAGEDRVSEDCKYFGREKDKNGEIYKPPVDNFMSYAKSKCRKRFTQGQINVMRYFALTSRKHLQQKIPDISADSVIIKNKWNTPYGGDISTQKIDNIINSRGKYPGKVLVFIYNNKFTWCIRMYNEMIKNKDIGHFFKTSYSFLKFDVNYRNNDNKVTDFLGNVFKNKYDVVSSKLELFFKSYINDLYSQFNDNYYNPSEERIKTYKPKYVRPSWFGEHYNRGIYLRHFKDDDNIHNVYVRNSKGFENNYYEVSHETAKTKFYYNALVPAILILNVSTSSVLDVKLGYQKDYEILSILKKHD